MALKGEVIWTTTPALFKYLTLTLVSVILPGISVSSDYVTGAPLALPNTMTFIPQVRK